MIEKWVTENPWWRRLFVSGGCGLVVVNGLDSREAIGGRGA